MSFVITPTAIDRRSLESADLCFISSSNAVAPKEPKSKVPKLGHSNLWFHPLRSPGDPEEVSPSRAAGLHGTIYRMHPEINYVMVVQPPYATSYCITGLPFNSAGIPESHIILHTVETLPIAAVLQDDGMALSKALDPASGKTTVLVEGYGLVTVGSDLLKTFVQVEVCESMCGVTLTALRRGSVTMLSKKQVEEIDTVFNNKH